MQQQDKVGRFFDKAAAGYRHNQDDFNAYYFGRRLDLALAQLPRPNDNILDIGCGRGALYDRLKPLKLTDNYLGIDLSAEMLRLSSIPTAKRRHLDLFTFAAQQSVGYDHIYALGFTTYLGQPQIAAFYHSLVKLLLPGGSALVSYTHQDAYDVRLRQLLNQLAGSYLPKRTSLGRNFPIYTTTPEKETLSLPAGLTVTSTQWLPPVFPLFPNLRRRWSQRGEAKILSNPGTKWRPDFILAIERLS